MAETVKKGLKTINKDIAALLDHIDHTGQSLAHYARLLQFYTDSDSPEQNYYQRINRIAKGESYHLTDLEAKAIHQIIAIENNPHTYGRAHLHAGNIDKKLTYISKALQSSFYNKTQTAKVMKDLQVLAIPQTTNS